MTTQTPEKRQEIIDELREIQAQMLECLEQAKTLIKQSGQKMTLQRAESYWLAHAKIALTNDHAYPAIGLGQAPCCNKQRFQKNRLAQGVLQGVGAASAVVADTVDEPASNESEEGAGNTSEVVARNQADDLEHACSCLDGVQVGAGQEVLMLAWNLADEGLPITCLESIPGDAVRRNAVLRKWGSLTQAEASGQHRGESIAMSRFRRAGISLAGGS